MLGDPAVRGQLDGRERDPIPLDPPGADGLSPDVDDRNRFDVDEVTHGTSWRSPS
jgi:hypothetical protein